MATKVCPLPGETRERYGELLERLESQEANRTLAHLRGGFSRKTISGYTYWYFKTSEGPSGQREYYLGSDVASTHSLMEDYARDREAIQEGQTGLSRLAAQVGTGGAVLIDGATARVIHGLAAAGVFRKGILVGSQAYLVLANHLGVSWPGPPFPAPSHLSIAVPARGDGFPEPLDALRHGRLPLAGLDPGSPETWFEVRGQVRRVCLLAPGGEETPRLPIPELRAVAQSTILADFLLEHAVRAVAISRGSTLVQVPDPASFAMWKLILAGRRKETQKAYRDRLQAFHVFQVLLDRSPGEIGRAAEDLGARGGRWREQALRSAARFPGLRESLQPFLE